MRYLLTLLFAALALNAVGQVNPNYNPDYNSDGEISVNDLLGFLSIFGNSWSSDIVSGCTYSDYLEYNSFANNDDGSCLVLSVNGCTDSDYNEYNVAANNDDGSCLTDLCPTIINHDGYDYSTVQIGNQCWFSENCRYLPSVSPSSEESETDPYYYVYGYEGTDAPAAMLTFNYDTYGVLYNWPAVMTEGICPSGWHIPTDGEFTELTDFLGGEAVAGVKMKDNSQWDGSNSSGFTGLPGGWISYEGFEFNGSNGNWWSASESFPECIYCSWRRRLYGNYGYVSRYFHYKSVGQSARCVRD